MALKKYEVTIGGLPHTVELDEEDAKRYRTAKPLEKKAAAPANKQAKPANKSKS
jgi:hypothetical protein